MAGGYKWAYTIWDTSTGKMLADVWDPGTYADAAISPDSRHMANINSGGWIGLYSLSRVGNTLNVKERIRRPDWEASAVAFSGDSAKIATADTGSIKIWSLKTDRKMAVVRGDVGATAALFFSAQGTIVLTASPHGVIKLWDVLANKLLATLAPYPGAGFVVMTPEGFFDASSYDAADAINVVQGMKVQGVGDFWDVFYRPDLVRAKLRGEDIRPLIGDMTMEKALQNPPPRVAFGAFPAQTLSTLLAAAEN